MRNMVSWCALIIVVCACCLPAGRPEPQCQGHGPPSSLPSSRAQAVRGMHPDGPRAAPTGAATGRVAACRHCSQQGLSLNLLTVQCVRQPSPAHATAAGSRGLRGSRTAWILSLLASAAAALLRRMSALQHCSQVSAVATPTEPVNANRCLVCLSVFAGQHSLVTTGMSCMRNNCAHAVVESYCSWY